MCLCIIVTVAPPRCFLFLGVLAAAKVVWVQTAIAMLHDVSSRAGIEAADPFANAIESSGAGLVVAWGVAALVAAGVALSGPGRPRLPAKLAASNLLGTACLVLPVTGVIVWADGYVAELTSEVVPAHLGFEVRGSAGIAVTDRGQLEHPNALPGLFYAANQVLQRIEQLGGIDHIPKAAIVVEPGPTELVADDGIIAFDDQRICDVRAFLVEILECDCERVTLTTDRDGVLRQVELDLSLR